MTERLVPVERLSEVARLATLLADRVLDAQIMNRPISDLQIRALLDAALVLEEHQMPLPPLLMQILHEVGTASSRDASDKTSRGRMGAPLAPHRAMTVKEWSGASPGFSDPSATRARA